MGLLRPKKLILEGFRSFKERQEILFPKTGSVLISGRHVDGSTGSGTGKSSVIMGLYYALGVCDVPQTELKNWHSKSMFVSLTLTDEVNEYEIIRDPKLKLIQNGIPYDGTSEGAETILKGILQVAPELVAPLTYRPQRSEGKFINQTDAKNKEFLSDILNLSGVEMANDQLNKEWQTIDSKVKITTANLVNLKANLSTLHVSDEAYAAAKQAYDDANNKVNLLADSENAIKEFCKELALMDSEQSKLNKVTQDVTFAQHENSAIRGKVQSIKIEMDALKQNMCPTCKREWDLTKDLVDKHQKEIDTLLERMKSNLTLIKNAEPLLAPEHQARINARKTELQTSMAQLKAPAQAAIETRRLASANLKTLDDVKARMVKTQKDIADNETQLLNSEIETHILEHAIEITGRTGFLGDIFDEVLVEINSRSNDILAHIPNINTFSLNISSSSVTQAGKVNKKIETSMVKDGKKISKKSLSGGQKTSVELATDLGVGETIRSRSGSILGWVALDEAMDGLDSQTKLAAIDIIKSKVNGLILVVDHDPIVREAFDMVIDIEFDGRNSCVRSS